ncbi:MAG TPA: hypothetical protein VLM89_01910, partial [Phycisphaerae bacterium]|nr:hypothetical protein [Phycisphaerae bacterium]
ADAYGGDRRRRAMLGRGAALGILAPGLLIAAPIPAAAADGLQDDLRTARRLHWAGPPGSRPGPCAEYLAQNPALPIQLRDVTSELAGEDEPLSDARAGVDIAILVNSALHPSITSALCAYKADLQAEGYAVTITTSTYGTPAQVKAWIQGRYSIGAEGIVLIGSIPVAWYSFEGDEFPCDLYYMDLDGT